ncbi:hypothetical protein [Leifsonia aquatica]|uniref:hypothetical protein n=1 Tax=Leifsonia aquatica TaxID=144185 RepID=UPI0038262B79
MAINLPARREDRELSTFRAKVLAELRQQISTLDDSDLRVAPEESPETVARRLLAQRRVKNEWDELVGPFYEVNGLMAWLGFKSRVNVHHAVQRGEILATPVGQRQYYPTFQFSRSGDLLPHLKEVLQVLRPAMSSPWTQALWLNTAVPSLGNRSPADALRHGKVDAVLRMAREDAGRRAS